MNSLDLIIRHGSVVTPTGVIAASIGIAGEKIVALASEISEPAQESIDASGCHIFPGVIDAHVHFNEPGRSEWEGLETGSKAVAAGGGVLFFDMPLNAHPPTIDAESFRHKRTLAEQKSVVDFALWGGLVPGNVDRLEELAECGVIGFKAFMSNSGIDDFSSVDDSTLREGMKRAAALKLPVAVHAESDAMTARLARAAQSENRTAVRDYLQSRPIAAELDAISRAIAIAGETNCALHVVHVSSAAGVQMIAAAHRAGIDVTCETCPHYLVLTDEDMATLGAIAKCAPPLRPRAERDALWQEVIQENILTIGSDHSPAPPGLKESADFFKVWGGISGAQHLLSLLLTYGHQEQAVPLPILSRLTATNVARRFKLPLRKGQISLGSDADLVIVNLLETREVLRDDLQYRHRQSPYIGRKLGGICRQTLVRGRTVFKQGAIIEKHRGQLVRPVAPGDRPARSRF